MLEAKAKDTSASALHKKKRYSQKFFRRSQKKKKRSSQKFFKRSPQKNVFQKIFQALHKILTIKKIVLSSSRGQANFRGLEAKAKDLTFEAKDLKICPRGLHLCLNTFVRVNPKSKELQFRTRQHTGYDRNILIIGSISIGGVALPPAVA